MKIEYDARQIMTQQKYRQISYKKLVKVDKNKKVDPTIIRINDLHTGTIALMRYAKHEKMIIKF
jgi:hypothetical protein